MDNLKNSAPFGETEEKLMDALLSFIAIVREVTKSDEPPKDRLEKKTDSQDRST